MYNTSEQGSTFSKTVSILIVVGVLAGYGIYLSQKALNDIYAEDIVNGVWERAKQERSIITPKDLADNDEEDIYAQTKRVERKGFSFAVLEGSTPSLIKVETEKRTISPGVCKALKKKFKESIWWDAFSKVVVVDRLGEEKTNVLVYDCPNEKISTLRFYVKFAETKEEPVEEVEEEEEKKEVPLQINPSPAPVVVPTSTPAPRPQVQPRNTTRTSSCPSGTSSNGSGGIATAGCRCNHSGETWNGRNCEIKNCPTGSSRNATSTGDRTSVSGCHCNSETPVWFAGKGMCIEKCKGDKVLDKETGRCICPDGTFVKSGSENSCVECNQNSDCRPDLKCINNQCVSQEEYEDCRWGICQTCDENGNRQNIQGDQYCEVAGLQGTCNNNGTCYPTEGRRCSSVRGCPTGEFCNYGGNFNSSKKQTGKFGQTPNVCQIINPQKFTYKDVVYYYNSEKDLKSWCRAANNTPNCLWGYLAKPGAISWCAGQGKRLLTKAEMAKVWNELKKELPKTYKGYAYWVEEGLWFEDFKGKRSFSNGHPDGYGGKGGVVCK